MRIDSKITKWDISTLVYLRANADMAGIITGVIVRRDGHHYLVVWGDHEESIHYEFELLDEKPMM